MLLLWKVGGACNKAKRLVDRESEQNEREEADVHKLSDIMAVMGLAVVFVGIAMFIACWG